MAQKSFTGDKKAPMKSPLADPEKRFILANVHRFPPWIEGYHLTLMTFAWSGGLLLFGFLAGMYSIHWLWGSSLMLFLQWFTDSFDGALGRDRDFGIPLWGFHMDHFLDFLFMWCVPVGYVFLVSDTGVILLFLIAFLYSMVMVNSFLDFGATGSFKITQLGLGPTEVRLIFIILNTVLILVGPGLLDAVLPYLFGACIVSLSMIVYQTQKDIWALDMENKREREAGE